MLQVAHFPHLEQFLSCYFHEDWMHDAPDMQGVIERYSCEISDVDLANTLAELQRLLLIDSTEKELDDLLMRLGNRYYFRGEDLTPKQWVRELSDRLSRIKAQRYNAERMD